MSTRSRRTMLACAQLAVMLIGGAVVAPAAGAATTDLTTTDPVQAAAGWLSTQLENRTHLPAPGGDHVAEKFGATYYPAFGANADVIFGLAAAKAGGAVIQAAVNYLAANVDAYGDVANSDGYGPYDGSVAKMALAAIVAGRDPTSFGGYNLMKTLSRDECAPASTTCTPGAPANIFSSVSDSFVILAEARAGGQYRPTTYALSYLSSLQCGSGGFTSGTTACGSGSADVDATSYAIMALAAAGGHAAAIGKAVTWLEGQETAGGYWVAQHGPNVNSTALAAAALAGQAVDVRGPRAWLLSQQVGAGAAGAGALKYAGTFSPTNTDATSPSVLATAQGLTGLVDGASLATLSGTGARSGVLLFAPAIALSSATVQAGHRQTAVGAGFIAGERVQAVMHSAVLMLGTVTAAPDGGASVSYTLPSSLAAGTHTVALIGLTSGLSASRAVTVTAAGSPPGAARSTGAVASTSSSATAPAPLAATGQDRAQLDEFAILGAIAVVLGAGLLAVGRRRAH